MDTPFALLVSLVGDRPTRFVFDQERVLVGRGVEADLRVEHAGMARQQFLIERGVGSAGEARFRITPYEATNPTHVNERPAVEGTLVPGDIIGITDIRIVLERTVSQKGRLKPGGSGGKEQVSPMRMVLLALLVGMALWVGFLLFGGDAPPDAGDLATAQVKMFLNVPDVRCANPIECDTRAHDANAKARKLLAQTGADPGNWYRAAIELEKASRFREQSGRPMPDLADLNTQLEQTRARAEAEFQDAKFRLSRASAAGDMKRCADEAALLARILPDDQHPYRVKLDAYRRTLPKKGESK
jgi:hypothetical protein